MKTLDSMQMNTSTFQTVVHLLLSSDQKIKKVIKLSKTNAMKESTIKNKRVHEMFTASKSKALTLNDRDTKTRRG